MNKPDRLSREEIWAKTEEFRQKFISDNQLPIPIEEIVEFDLNLQVLPTTGLRDKFNIDGFLTKDMTTIQVDNRLLEDRFFRRYRFTLAHEVGHFWLHKDMIKSVGFTNIDEWKGFVKEGITDDDYGWFEYQAYEFAGRLLVPINHLKDELEKQRDKIEQYLDLGRGLYNEPFVNALSRVICSKFEVSPTVIAKRIDKEDALSNFEI